MFVPKDQPANFLELHYLTQEMYFWKQSQVGSKGCLVQPSILFAAADSQVTWELYR